MIILSFSGRGRWLKDERDVLLEVANYKYHYGNVTGMLYDFVDLNKIAA